MSQRDFDGKIADLYDVFVDWPGRLGREMPGLVARLRSIGARRVLDVGCGTGQHVAALRACGFDAHGSDASDAMLDVARAQVADADFTSWRLEDRVPTALKRAAPFDAVLALGNVWPQLVNAEASDAALANVRSMLRTGGLIVFGLKAFALRRDAGDPYLPLLRREHDGRALFFVRFLDFASQDVAAMHFMILAADGGVIDHRVAPVRVWSADDLHRAVAKAGFTHVAVSGSIGDPQAAVTGEDVFVHAVR